MADNALVQALSDALKNAPGVLAAFLFGSHATGRAHRESDIDVGVLLDRAVYPTDVDRFEARLRLIGTIGAAVASSSVDLVVLNDVSPVFARAVVYDGERVYCRDAEALHAFVRDTALRAADLDPWLRRMRRLTLDAIGS